MAQDITVLVCDDQAKATQANGFLSGLGFQVIVNEQAAHSLYDAAHYDGGVTERQTNKWIVIGRK